MARIIGNTGEATMDTHTVVANAWSMSVSRVVNDVTAFGDSSSAVIGGVPTYTGSVSGFMETGSDAPDLDVASFATGTEITVLLTANSGCTYTGEAVVSGASISTSKTGDATISFDFTFTGAVTEAWS